MGTALFGLLAAIFWLRESSSSDKAMLTLLRLVGFCLHGRQRYMLVLCVSTTTMCLGFIIRIPLTSSPSSLGIYIITNLAGLAPPSEGVIQVLRHLQLTLLSPCGFLAHDYLLLPRLAAHLQADDALFIRPRLIAKIFITSDCVTFWLQATGGGMTAVQNANIGNIGHWVRPVQSFQVGVTDNELRSSRSRWLLLLCNALHSSSSLYWR